MKFNYCSTSLTQWWVDRIKKLWRIFWDESYTLMQCYGYMVYTKITGVVCWNRSKQNTSHGVIENEAKLNKVNPTHTYRRRPTRERVITIFVYTTNKPLTFYGNATSKENDENYANEPQSYGMERFARQICRRESKTSELLRTTRQ